MKKWSFESVKIEAKKYEYRKDFQKESPGAYRAAQRNGWLDLVCSHMTVLWENKWSYENVINEARKYKYKSDFIKKSPYAYNAAWKNNWLPDIEKILEEKPNKWCFENVLKEAQKYKTRNEFRKGNQSAYNSANKNGWLDEICKHMIAMKKSWTFEAVRDEAKKFSSRLEFSQKSGVAYHKACRNGWLDEVCSHIMHANIKWTKDLLVTEAQKYKTRIDFQNESGGAYSAARNQGILDEICDHMEKRLPWTFERVLFEAKKYKTKTEFCKNSYQASKIAKEKGWYENVCSHMDVLWEQKWDYESVINEARKYKYRSDFQKGAPGAYGKARIMGWLEECQAHMIDRPIKWTDKAIHKEALKFESRTEFANESGSAYKAASDKGILDSVCKHMKILHNGYNHCVYVIRNDRLNKAYVGVTSQKFELRMQQHRSDNNPCLSKEITSIPDTIFEQITDYIFSPDDVKEHAEREFVDLYEAEGYIILNHEKSIGNVGYSKRKWNLNKCHIEAMKYSTRWDFQKYSVNAYSAAKTHGWLDDICYHMISTKKPPSYWTKEKCILEAKKYNSRNEFRKKSTYVYKIITSNGWIEDVCKHLPVKIYYKWEKTNSNIEIWKRASDFYDGWILQNKCSGYRLCRTYGLKGYELNSMVNQFRQGWIPKEDEAWIDWISTD